MRPKYIMKIIWIDSAHFSRKPIKAPKNQTSKAHQL